MLYLGPDKQSEPEIQQVADEVPDWPRRFEELHNAARDQRLRDFYGAGVVAADTPLAEVPLVAVDFETTGFDPRENHIVSIGLIPLSLQRIHCRDARQWVLKPAGQLTATSVVVHRITHSDLEQAPAFAEIVDDLLLALAGRVLVVHYRGIERPFLDAACRHALGEGIEFPVIDTMELEARLHRSQPPGILRRVADRVANGLRGRKPVSIRLADSRSRYQLPYYSPHHALTDALATAELLHAQVAHRFSSDTPVSLLWK